MSNALLEIPKDWSEASIEEIAEDKKGAIKIGPFGSALKKSEMVSQGIRVYGQENVFQNNFRVGKYYITEEKYERLKSCTLYSGDVVITMMGSVGNSTVVPENIEIGIMDSHLLRIQVNVEIFDKYLLAILLRDSELIKTQVVQLSQGGIMSGLNASIVKSIKLPVPPLPEQKKIASILTSVDEAIEKQEAQISKLQDLKKAMMQELLTKGIGHTEFKDSPVGRIPKGWEVVRLGELGQVVTGNTPKTSERDNYSGVIPFVSPVDIGTSMFINETKSQISEKGLSKIREIPPNAVLVVCIGSTIGKVSMTVKRCGTNQQINSVICQDNDPRFVYYLMTSLSKVIRDLAGTQAVPIINKSSFSNILVQKPSVYEQEEIANILTSVDKSIESKRKKMAHSISLKKALMQDLLTGKVRVQVN